MTSLFHKIGILGSLFAFIAVFFGLHSPIAFADQSERGSENPAQYLTADSSDPFGAKRENIGIDAHGDEENLYDAVTSIINYLLLFLGLLLLVIIIYAGFLIINSNGDDEALTKGRTIIMYALVGVIIIVLSYTIVNFITDAANGGGD